MNTSLKTSSSIEFYESSIDPKTIQSNEVYDKNINSKHFLFWSSPSKAGLKIMKETRDSLIDIGLSVLFSIRPSPGSLALSNSDQVDYLNKRITRWEKFFR